MEFEPIAQFQDRAIGWLLKWPENMHALLRLLLPELEPKIELESMELMESTLIPEGLKKLEEDVIYQARVRGGGSLVTLVAHQSVGDPLMSQRLFSALSRLYETDSARQLSERVSRSKVALSPVFPLVVHSGERPWRPPALEALFPNDPVLRKCAPMLPVWCVDLATVTPAELLARGDALCAIFALFAVQYDDLASFKDVLKRVLDQLSGMNMSRETLASYQRFCVRLALERRPRKQWTTLKPCFEERLFWEEPNGMESMADYLRKKGFDVGLKEGRKEGRDEGLKQGQRQGRLAGIASVVAVKFPDQDEESVMARLESLSEEQLTALTKRLFVVESWEELWASE